MSIPPDRQDPTRRARAKTALRRCVNGRSETCRSGAQNQNVVDRARQPPSQVEMFGQLFACRSFEQHVTSVSHHGIRVNVFANPLEFKLVFIYRGVEPFVWDTVAEQQLNCVECGLVIASSVDT